MYLSRLILNPRSRRAQRELAEPYEMHRSLMKAFPSNLSSGSERVLFRVDEIPELGPALLVQSWDAPNWSWSASEGAPGYLQSLSEPNPAVKQFELHPVAGQLLTFRLRANPTVRKHTDDSRSIRVGLVSEDKQLQWLARKAEVGGFRVLSANVAREHRVECSIHRADVSAGTQATHDLTLCAVRFDGVLEVTDSDKLVATVKSGIGSGKGFGFGLLSLAPARS